MYKTFRILLLFAIYIPTICYSIRDIPNDKFSKFPRAGPEEPVGRPHQAPVPAERPIPNQQASREEDIANLIQFPKRPSWIEDYGDNAGKTLAIQQLHSASEGGTKPVLLYNVEENGELSTKQPVDLLAELRNLEEQPGSNGKVFRLVQQTEIGDIDPATWKVIEVQIGWNIFHYSPYKAIAEQLAQFDARQQARISAMSRRPGTWWARVAKRSSVVTNIIQSEDQAATNSTTEQDLVDEFQLYLDALYTVEAKMSDLVVPVLDDIKSQTKSSFIHSMAQSILYDITGSTTMLKGPLNFGMSYLGHLTNATSSPINVSRPNSPLNFTNVNATSPAAILTAMENLYSAMWVNAMNAANSTGLLPRHALLLEYLSTNNTALYPSGFTITAGSNSTQAEK